MDPSAPKRRKTSPTESIPVESTTPPGPPPPQQDERPNPQPSPSRSSRRPSFAAPTNASLARHNPDVLTRRRATASQRSDDLPASRPTSRDENSEVENAPPVISERPAASDGSTTVPGAEIGPTTLQRGASNPPARRAESSALSAQRPRPIPTRPQPRPLPPPDPTDQQEEVVNPFIGRMLRRSPTNTGVIPTIAREEPRLPPTPQHPDPVVSTPPSGIHNTPSKRRRDGAEREAFQPTSSPVKNLSSQEERPQKPQKQVYRAGVVQGARRRSPVQAIEELETPPVQPIPSKEESRKGFAPRTHPRRSVRLRGPNWEKTQKRDALLQEIAQLEADLEFARSEHMNAARGSPSNNDPDTLLDLLRRRLLPAEKEPEPDANARWIEAAMDPFAMLGFSGQPSTQFPPVLSQIGPEKKAQPPIISHHPIVMTASEELPFLQVFTPLTFTTKIATIPSNPDQSSPNTQQRYTINIRSASPPGLFTTQMEMVVSTRNQAIASLAVPHLDPAASSELRSFVDLTTNTNTPYHPALTRNVSILCFAMGEWYRVALKRAKFWHALDSAFGPGNKDGFANAVTAMRSRKKRKRRAREASEIEGGVAESHEGVDSLGSLDGMVLSKKELIPHMGRTSMDLEVPYFSGDPKADSSEVRVSWFVEFDWAGVAKNKLAVEVGVPGKCKSTVLYHCPCSITDFQLKGRAVDERKSIVGIPKLFTKLLQGGEDPLTAVKTVVALLAGEPGS